MSHLGPLDDIAEDLARLAPPQQLAVLARCARRLERVFVGTTPYWSEDQRMPVLAAIAMAEQVVAGASANVAWLAEGHAVCKEVSKDCIPLGDGNPPRRSSACITLAIRAAVSFLRGGDVSVDVVKGLASATKATYGHPGFLQAIRDDVAKAALAGEGVPGGDLGALWPRGEPEEWPDAAIGYDVMISYAHQQQPFVRGIASLLRSGGARVWYDEHGVEAGQVLPAEVFAAIAMARHGVVVLSHEYFRSGWTRSEMMAMQPLWREGRMKLLPIRYLVSSEDIVGYRCPQLVDVVSYVGQDAEAAVSWIETALGRPRR